ncbi:MAG: 50S ribosomal protein L33 [Candidatus Omnitrophica bacterium]|nr:50S ribosomal protein L33 [Candidatus Omnitrophota bacterium]
MREIITFECSVCRRRNYNSTKDKKKNPKKLELKKFCRFCRKHTVHKEIK